VPTYDLVEATTDRLSTGNGGPVGLRIWRTGAVAPAIWLVIAGLTVRWPDAGDVGPTAILGLGMAAIGIGLLLASAANSYVGLSQLSRTGPWTIALALLLVCWELATAKLDLLPRPFFVSPQALIRVYVDDRQRLADCTWHSLALLVTGYATGAVLGFLCGVAIGWWRCASYWMQPLLRFVGPVPAVAWLPMAFFVFPSSWSAAVFLIALATGFPVTVLTWSGIASVNAAYYDVARTLGARPGFLILRVAIPAALPSVFVGLFMGLGASFSVLVVAEMMGVRVGLGWYIIWAQGWAAYANMYAALFLIALMCSSVMSLLFRLRHRLLGWQQGLLRW
jgi:NitT/TauT family transport system permease protein